MLTDLERNVDSTESKLGNAMRRMKWFIRQTEGKILYEEYLLISLYLQQRRNRAGV